MQQLGPGRGPPQPGLAPDRNGQPLGLVQVLLGHGEAADPVDLQQRRPGVAAGHRLHVALVEPAGAGRLQPFDGAVEVHQLTGRDPGQLEPARGTGGCRAPDRGRDRARPVQRGQLQRGHRILPGQRGPHRGGVRRAVLDGALPRPPGPAFRPGSPHRSAAPPHCPAPAGPATAAGRTGPARAPPATRARPRTAGPAPRRRRRCAGGRSAPREPPTAAGRPREPRPGTTTRPPGKKRIASRSTRRGM